MLRYSSYRKMDDMESKVARIRPDLRGVQTAEEVDQRLAEVNNKPRWRKIFRLNPASEDAGPTARKRLRRPFRNWKFHRRSQHK